MDMCVHLLFFLTKTQNQRDEIPIARDDEQHAGDSRQTHGEALGDTR
jgi:hypothetical protein